MNSQIKITMSKQETIQAWGKLAELLDEVCRKGDTLEYGPYSTLEIQKAMGVIEARLGL